MFRKLFNGLGAGIIGIIVLCIATVTTFAVPVLLVMYVGHIGFFAKHTPGASSIAFCSTLNKMTAYAETHPTPTTPSQYVTQISYSADQLASAKSVPTTIRGTVDAAISTSSVLLSELRNAISNGGWTTTQEQQALADDRVFISESKTLKTWYYANC